MSEEEEKVVKCDVLIIGGGVAGLGAARYFATAPHGKDVSVVVVEARDKYGGRFIVEDCGDFGTQLVGARFVHGEGHLFHRWHVKEHPLVNYPDNVEEYYFEESSGLTSTYTDPFSGIGDSSIARGITFLDAFSEHTNMNASRWEEFPPVEEYMPGLFHRPSCPETKRFRERSVNESWNGSTVSSEESVADSLRDSLADSLADSIDDNEREIVDDGPPDLEEAKSLYTAMCDSKDIPMDDDGMKLINCLFCGDRNTDMNHTLYLDACRSERDWPHDDELNAFMQPSSVKFVDELASGLDVRLSQVVTRVDQEDPDKPVRVHTREYIHHKRIKAQIVYECKYVIVTVPLYLLKRTMDEEAKEEFADEKIEFSPAISKEKQLAINKMYAPPMAKAFLRFKKPLWPANLTNVLCGTGPVPEYWVHIVPKIKPEENDGTTIEDYDSCSIKPILSAFLSGPWLEKMVANANDEDVPDMPIGFEEDCWHILCKWEKIALVDMQEHLASMFSVSREDLGLTYASFYNWGDIPFIRSGYTTPCLTVPERTAVCAREGRILFAGEGMNIGQDVSVMGAINSGCARAAEILEEI